MAETTEKKDEKRVVNISAFFNRNNETEGVWFEPKIDGEGLGIEFKVIGINSDEASESEVNYRRELDKIETLKDQKVKNDKILDAMASHAAELIKDVRAKDGVVAEFNDGKELVYSREGMKTIMSNSTILLRAILNFSASDKNFMNKNLH